jgi:hypothetical protein
MKRGPEKKLIRSVAVRFAKFGGIHISQSAAATMKPQKSKSSEQAQAVVHLVDELLEDNEEEISD